MKYRIGGLKNGAITNYMRDLGLNVIVTSSQDKLLLPLVISGTLDLIPSLETTMIARLRNLGLSYDSVEKTMLICIATSRAEPGALPT